MTDDDSSQKAGDSGTFGAASGADENRSVIPESNDDAGDGGGLPLPGINAPTLPPPPLPPRPEMHIVRDIVEACAIVLILVLLINNFAFQAYKVPTGSMEPTIIGHEKDGDRLIVSRLPYLFREPRRWEVAVFLYPNNRTITYVKRIVGCPNETIFILAGDIYTAPYGSEARGFYDTWKAGKLKIERKPRATQRDLFDMFPEIAPEDVKSLTLERFHSYWNVPNPTFPGEVEWSFEDGKAHLRSRTTSQIGFRDLVSDNRQFMAKDDVNVRGGHNVVGDMRLRVRVEAVKAGGKFQARIVDPQHSMKIECEIPVEGEKEDGGILLDSHLVVPIAGYRLPVGEAVDVTFINVDNAIEIEIDGEVKASHEYDHQPLEVSSYVAPPPCLFGGAGGEFLFDRIALHRDIHYQNGQARDTSGALSKADIGDRQYYMLGDNSPCSKDSREWQATTIHPMRFGERPILGDVEAVLDPNDLTSRLDNPWWDSARKRRYFLDQFGNLYDVTSGGPGVIQKLPSPLVHRDLILGRAVAVFMPRAKIIR